MNRIVSGLLIALMSTAAYAQVPQPPQPPADPAFMQRAIAALQTQRNQALDSAAAVEARAAIAEAKVSELTTELAKERAHSKELEDKLNPVKKDETPKK